MSQRAMQSRWGAGREQRAGAGSGGSGRIGRRSPALWAALCAALLGLPAWTAAAAPDVPAGAAAGGAPDGPNRDDFRAELALLLGAEQARPGEKVRIGVLFELDPGWHIYWRNSGDSGLPTELDWKLAGGSVGPLLWPAPETFSEGDLTTYGYADRVLLMNELELAPDAAPGPLELAVTANFLICKRLCIPGKAQLKRTLQIGPEVKAATAETAELFESFGARVPVPAAELGLEIEGVYSQSAIRPSDEFRGALAVVPRDSARALRPAQAGVGSFWPDVLPGAEVKATGSRAHPTQSGGFVVTLAGRALADAAPEGAERLRGVLGVQLPEGVRFAEVEVPFPRAAAGAAVTPTPQDWFTPAAAQAGGVGELSLWRALLLGLAGGLILNLMPCVLPVLAIKVVRVAELAHAGRRAVLAQGGAYTLGILVCMLGLAAGVIALRSAGTAVGWGFQFQEPRFVVGISAVLVLFALNLFGVFEIDATPSGAGAALGHGGPLRRSFFEGLLAVVLATPCSAPFLGTAVGFAFAGSSLQIAAIFAAIGLGLAAPFVLVTLVPGWARFIPRAGAWMLHLRTLLGFALLATVVWLLWLLGLSSGTDTLVALVAFLITLGFAAWLFGLAQRAERGALGAAAALLLAACAAGGVAWLPIGAAPAPGQAGAPARAEIEGEQRFEQAAVQAALGAGRPVFVFFTADWCLTCKVNERFVLGTEPVRAELASLGVATFKGDWTRRDDVIRAELERHGRAGVPMYLVYRPDAPGEPRVLPELLTAETLLASLRWAAEGKVASAAAPRS